MDNFIFYLFKQIPDFKLASFLFSIVVSVSLLLVPFGYFFNDFQQKVIDLERKNKVAKDYPYLICKEHLTRTFIQSYFIHNEAICRNNGNCYNKNIVYAKKLIGCIGDSRPKVLTNENLYVELFCSNEQIIKNGDYDIIEVHKSSEIHDYDAIINKVTSFLYNELNRYKPIKQITIRVFGNIIISENTKRLMEKYYFGVEYF